LLSSNAIPEDQDQSLTTQVIAADVVADAEVSAATAVDAVVAVAALAVTVEAAVVVVVGSVAVTGVVALPVVCPFFTQGSVVENGQVAGVEEVLPCGG
jgi:hypothetical protein